MSNRRRLTRPGPPPAVAALALVADAVEADGDQSEEIRLLSDIRNTFADLPHIGFLGTKTLLEALRRIEDAPWGETRNGSEFTARKLALKLAEFKVRPRHNPSKTERGYHLEDFRDVFPRYLPSDPSRPVRTEPDQRQHRDETKTPDGSTRPAEINRPDETAGQAPYGRDGTGRTDSPLDWPADSAGAEANR